MSVTQQNPLNSYTANGATTVFPYSFLILLAADLVVQVTDTQGAVSVKTLGVDYTVTGIGSQNGGNVTMLAAPASGSRVVVFRLTGLLRSTDYQQNGDLPSATLNADFDRIWLAIQELANGLQGMPMALRAPTGETFTALPSASVRANTALLFGPTGDVIVGAPASGSAADLAINLASTNQAGKGADMVGVRDVGSLITATTVEGALQELASGKLSKSGGTMTGALTLPGNATNPLHAMPLQQATGRLLGVRVFTTADSGSTYTPTTGTTSVIVQAVGGGGSGGGNEATTSSNADCAAGGSAGRFGMGRYTSSFAGVTLTVGGGGVGIAGGFGTGGGTTSFGSLLSCPGGNSGSRTGLVGLPGTALAGHPAEAAAAAGANIFDTAGSKGSHGFILGNGSLSGQGGSSPFGSGGAAVVPGAAPANGSGYGSGGGGVVSTNSGARAGGNGSPGVIIVWEYA